MSLSKGQNVTVRLVVGVLAVLVLSGCATEADGGREVAVEDSTTTTGSPEKVTRMSGSPETTPTTQQPAEGPEPTCAYLGADPDFGYMQVDLAFTNPLGEVDRMEVTYALLDGEGGTRFFTGTAGGLDLVDIMFPKVNEQFRVLVDTREEVPPNVDAAMIDCRVLGTEQGTDIGGFVRATDSDMCTVLGDDASGVQVDLSVTSPYTKTTKVQVWWALQGPGDVRFYTDTKVVDLVGAGETIQVSEDSGRDVPDWIGDGPIACAVAGFWDQDR